METATELQARFGIADVLTVSEKAPGYPVIHVDNPCAKAAIALHGAHIIEFQPSGEEPVLWLSSDAVFSAGKAIRGGIPICWPWFGGHPEGQLPAHGFVRNRFWQLQSTQQLDNGFTRLIMSTCDDDASRVLWNHRFRLRLVVVVGNTLSVTLEMQNPGDSAYTITAALHSYFNVADISKVHISGLDGVGYMDQLLGNHWRTQYGDVHIAGEVDRIYHPVPADEIVCDQGFGRRIRLGKTGSCSSIVWNPWIDKSGSMGDFQKGGYRHMVCVETGNVAGDKVRLAPGSSHSLGLLISVERN